MEEILIWTGLYICFALIALGAYLAFQPSPKSPTVIGRACFRETRSKCTESLGRWSRSTSPTTPCIWIGPSTSRHNRVIGWS